MNINDIHVDKAIIAAVVNPHHDTMLKRGYPAEIADRVALIKDQTAKLSADLSKLCESLQKPASPGFLSIPDLPL